MEDLDVRKLTDEEVEALGIVPVRPDEVNELQTLDDWIAEQGW